ncbi:hypothetical protein GCM10027168_25650 [Streptomyces capparidis]
MPHLALADVDALAERAHRGQTDLIGVPYVAHVRAVARGLAPLGERYAAAGLLHDVIEDTGWTAPGLLAAGVDPWVVDVVERVTRTPGVPYPDMIRAVAAYEPAALVKIADNAHNSHPDRAAALPAERRAKYAERYRAARAVLWPAVDPRALRAVLERVNPALLAEAEAGTATGACTGTGES